MTNQDKWVLVGIAGAVAIYVVTKKRTTETGPVLVGPDPVGEALRPTGVSAGMQALAQAIALAEGFGVPGAKPTRYHNPGDLTRNGVIIEFPDDTAGWQALYHQLQYIVSGQSRVYSVDDSIAAMARKWTATQQPEWTANVVNGLQQNGYDVTDATPLRDFLT